MGTTVKPCSFLCSRFSLNSWLVWTGALSIIKTAGRWSVLIKWSILAITIALVTLPSITTGVKEHSLLINPRTLKSFTFFLVTTKFKFVVPYERVLLDQVTAFYVFFVFKIEIWLKEVPSNKSTNFACPFVPDWIISIVA